MKTPEQLAREYSRLLELDRDEITIKQIMDISKDAFLAGYSARKEEIRDTLIRYTESIRDYERESHNMIGFDERDDEEFVDIFLNEE